MAPSFDMRLTERNSAPGPVEVRDMAFSRTQAGPTRNDLHWRPRQPVASPDHSPATAVEEAFLGGVLCKVEVAQLREGITHCHEPFTQHLANVRVSCVHSIRTTILRNLHVSDGQNMKVP